MSCAPPRTDAASIWTAKTYQGILAGMLVVASAAMVWTGGRLIERSNGGHCDPNEGSVLAIRRLYLETRELLDHMRGAGTLEVGLFSATENRRAGKTGRSASVMGGTMVITRADCICAMLWSRGDEQIPSNKIPSNT